jgi:hypothetical protein
VAPLIFWRCGRHTDRQDRWMSAKLRPISQIDVCNGDPRLYDECVFSQQVGLLVGGKLWGVCVANAIIIRRRSPVYP